MAEDYRSRLDGILTRDLTFGTVCTLAIMAGIGVAQALGIPWVLLGVLGLSLLYVALYDLRFMLLPDAVTLPLIALGFVNVIWTDPPFLDRLIGAAVGLVVLVAINLAYRLLWGRDGLGFGDAKLLAAAGAWLGWQALPVVLLLASGLGILTALFIALRKGGLPRDTAIAFGPFIAIGFFLGFLWTLIPSL